MTSVPSNVSGVMSRVFRRRHDHHVEVLDDEDRCRRSSLAGSPRR